MTDLAIYRDEQHAVIRAMTIDAITTCKPAQWQQQYSSGYVEDLTKKHSDLERLTLTERLTQDAMTRAKIHRSVTRGAFYSVVAKYGADESERVEAVDELSKIITCDGVSSDFKKLIIWTWASINIKRGFIEKITDMCEQSRRTIFYKKKIIVNQLNEFEASVRTDAGFALSDLVQSNTA